MASAPDSGWISSLVGRALFLAVCWWAVAEGDAAAWAMGVPAVAVALLLSLRLHPPQPLRWRGLASFLPLFLWRSLVGGVDVATRALAPRLRLEPTLIDFPLQLRDGLPRVVFANVVSLLPGTLSADLDDDTLRLHILSQAAGDEEELRALERAVAALFA